MGKEAGVMPFGNHLPLLSLLERGASTSARPSSMSPPTTASVWDLILEQFNDTLVWILLAAAVVSFVLAWLNGDEIFLILVLNAIVGFWQENIVEKALQALKEIQSEHAAGKRDGILLPNFPAKEIVPGDIVELRVGDKVPADMRILFSDKLDAEGQTGVSYWRECCCEQNQPQGLL